MPVACRVDDLQQLRLRTLRAASSGCRRRIRRGASGLAGMPVVRCPSRARFRSAWVGNRGPVQPPAELLVDPARGVMQVEALQAGRSAADSAALPYGRLPTRHGSPSGIRTSAPTTPCTAEDPATRPTQLQAFALQPPQMIHQQIGVRPLRTRPLIPPQEPVSLLLDRTLRPHDREGPTTITPLDPLHPQITHNEPTHPYPHEP